MLCFRKFPVAKKFMDQRGGAEYQAFSSTVLSHSADKICRETLLCCVSEISCSCENYESERRSWGSIKIFRRKIFVSQSRKTSYKKLSVFH